MAKSWGLTEAQARKLIELAKERGVKARVRTFRKENSQHAGRAFLLRVVNKYQAIIKPFTHRKEEVVNLSSLDFWVSGNEFDLTPAMLLIEGAAAEPILQPAFAATAFEFAERSSCEEASADFVEKTTQEVVEEKPVEHKVEVMANHTNKTEPATIVKVAQATTMPIITDTELAAMLQFDASKMASLIEEGKKLAGELNDIEAMRLQITQRLDEVKSQLKQLSQQMHQTTMEETHTPRKIAKRGFVQSKIVEAVKISPRLDMRSLVERVLGQSPTSSYKSISLAVRNMAKAGLLEEHDNGYSLPSKGRSKA